MLSGQNLVLAICISATSCAHIDVPPAPTHPILGSWKFVVPGETCVEVYTFQSNGTRLYTSAEELGESSYKVSTEPSTSGFYTLTDTITRNNGKPDCSGGTTPVGDKATRFIRFLRSREEFILCLEESVKACIGPFSRFRQDAS